MFGLKMFATLHKNTRLGMVVVLLFLMLVLVRENVRNTSSDPRGTLLVSEAIIQHGTLKLDHIDEATLASYGYVFYEKNGHHYNYFPIGTALLSAPFVALANVFGIEMLKHEPIVQMALVAVISLTLYLVLFSTACLYISQQESLILSTICWFGSAYTSTLGTALWSHDFAVLFASIAIYLVMKSIKVGDFSRWPLVTCCFFLAYLCRPTFLLLPLFLYFVWFFYDKISVFKSAFLLAVCVLFFVIFSYLEFGQYLPDYYLPQRLAGGNLGLALVGNLISPARGLWVYSPFLIIPLLLAPKIFMQSKASRLMLIVGLIWPLVHLVFISRFPHWWAGWTYGARLMVDALPGLFLLLFYSISKLERWPRKIAFGMVIVTGLVAMYFNTAQGVFNRYSVLWNAAPNIDANPHYLFDWQYPPFLHNEARHLARLKAFEGNAK